MEATKVGGQVRRIHIIYFLSRMGRIEHPHLIRVHHLNRNGVYLRDIKRWLADLRGKDMPDAFAWSYKRRYKSGYVWQDLLDDDLITPISDNEYVLKGSEIMPTNAAFGPRACGEKEASILKSDNPVEVENQQQQQQQPSPKEEIQIDSDPKIDTPTKISSEIFQESPMFGSERSSTLTDDSIMKHEEEEEANKQVSEKFDNYYSSSSSFYSTLLNKKNKKKTNEENSNIDNNNMEKNIGTPSSSFSSSSSSSKSTYTKSKSYSSGASHMFRNLISCGAVDTNDNVLVMLNRGKNKPTNKQDNKTEICKREKMGGSARVFGTCWNQQQQHNDRKSFDAKKQSEFASSRPISAAYKPVGGPTCSQCGKLFKPEKLHTHMKSCKGMKALAKTAAASVEKAPSQRSVNSSHKESTSGYFLAN